MISFYFSNVYDYDAATKTLYVVVVKNGQMNKDLNAFVFSNLNNSYLTVLKICGVASIMTGENNAAIEIYENSFNTTDYKIVWNSKTDDYSKLGSVYYKVKKDFTNIIPLPVFEDQTYYLLDAENEYVLTYDKKPYALSFGEYDITRKNHSQNLYQIFSDEKFYYFVFSETGKESFNKGLQDNYLNMPAVCRVWFDKENNKIYISDSLYLSQAKPTFEVQNWEEKSYILTAVEPEIKTDLPETEEATNLDDLKTLVISLTGDYYWKDLNNPKIENSDYYYRFWFGNPDTSGDTPLTFFTHLRMKGNKKGAGKYKNNTVTQPVDDLYTDEINAGDNVIVVYGHLKDNKTNGAVYEPEEYTSMKYAVWIVSEEGVKISSLYDSLEECKKANPDFETYTWK